MKQETMKYYPEKGRRVLSDLDDLFSFPVDFFKPMGFSLNSMKTDVIEKDGKMILDIEMPGLNKEDIKVSLKDGYLTVSASHNEEKEEKDDKGTLVRKERSSGSMSRSFYVGEDVTVEEINGSYENGMLKLEVPKKEPVEAETKFIEIK